MRTSDAFYRAIGAQRTVVFGESTEEIEHLCDALMAIANDPANAVVRAIAYRIKRLNSAVLSALTDDVADIDCVAAAIGLDFQEHPLTVARH